MDNMRTASGVSRDTKASENLSVGFESIHIDELVENQDDQEERPRTGPERNELQSAGLASVQQDEPDVQDEQDEQDAQDDKSLQSFKSHKGLDNKLPQRMRKRTRICSIATLISSICVATVLFIWLSGFLVFWLFAFLVIDAKEHQKDEIQGDEEGQEIKQTQRKFKTKMAKRRGKAVTLTLLISSILSVTIVFIWYHLQGNEPEIVNGQNVQQEVTSNESCSFWHITGDEYCDDEANIVECGYDFKDCCDMENDRSLCMDCLCYIPEEEKILLDEEFNKNCLNEINLAWGDTICDLSLNNKENYFDVGDCCLENPKCMSFAYEANYMECPENSCIQSNTFCILEELGDGICQGHNNGPFCQYDLGDCCSVPGNFTNCCCNCDCKKVNFVYDYDGFLNTHA